MSLTNPNMLSSHIRFINNIQRVNLSIIHSHAQYIPPPIPTLNFAAYLALDYRDQAVLRDVVVEFGNSTSRQSKVGNSTSRQSKVGNSTSQSTNPISCRDGDPRVHALQRDKHIQDAQYAELKSNMENLETTIYTTSKAIEKCSNEHYGTSTFRQRQLKYTIEGCERMRAMTKKSLYKLMHQAATSYT